MGTRERLTEIVFEAFDLDGRRQRDHETADSAVTALLAEVAKAERYNGWANRETWAVALHINNDQGWQESVHEALRTSDPFYGITDSPSRAGEVIRENVEETLDGLLYDGIVGRESFAASKEAASFYRGIVSDIGSLWRVDWTELGATFLADLQEMGE